MGLAATVLAGVGTVTAGVIVKVLADDVKEWTPKITERLIKAAVQWLPEDQRERYGEEWAGHVWETPGTLAKILVIITLPLAVLEARERHARVALEIWSGQYYAVIGQMQARIEALAVRAESGYCVTGPDLMHIVHELFREKSNLAQPSMGFTLVAARFAIGKARNMLYRPCRKVAIQERMFLLDQRRRPKS